MVVALRLYRDALNPELAELERGPCVFTILPDEPNWRNIWARATESRVRVACTQKVETCFGSAPNTRPSNSHLCRIFDAVQYRDLNVDYFT